MNELTAFEQRKALVAVGIPQPIVTLLATARYEADRAAKALAAAASVVEDKAARVGRLVAEGKHVNQLGEMQSSAVAVDLACGRYELANQMLEEVRATVKSLLADLIAEVEEDGNQEDRYMELSRLVCEF